MTLTTGRNKNTNDIATTTIVSINSTTATTILASNANRLMFSATLAPGSSNADIHIRFYAATTDNIKQGWDVLTRKTAGNDNLFHPNTKMSVDNIYTGEISAISESGTFDILVTEF